ncbi:MAG TPA: TAXI family TRAP transporter solute-binding subunit [Geminicoccaceae bacterium]|nr:TAXI family TRAP transporter solute-binding subunit [Geminicoccaceae bacterium]
MQLAYRLLPALPALLWLAVADAQAATMRLCTGSPGKTYIQVGERLAELAPQLTMGGLEIQVVATGGSIENLDKTLAGECDAFIAQGDALEFYQRQIAPDAKERLQIVGELYKELALLLCRRGTGIDDLDEVGSETVAAGGTGSGSLATFLTLQQLDPETYGDIKIFPANGFEGALAVIDGRAACLFDVIAPQSDLVRVLDDNERTQGQLYFAEIDNDDLEEFAIDGKRIYEVVTFDDEIYENLNVVGDPETLAISAVLGVSRDFIKAQPQVMSALSMLSLMSAKDVQALAYGERKPFKE